MDTEKMTVEIMVLNSFAIAFAYSIIAFRFMRPSRITKATCFLLLFAMALAIQIFFSENPLLATLVNVLVQLLNFAIISFYINANMKNNLKAANITLTMMLLYSVFVYLLSSILFTVFPKYFSFENTTYNIIMQVCVVSFAIVLGKNRNYFFNQTPNIGLTQKHITP